MSPMLKGSYPEIFFPESPDESSALVEKNPRTTTTTTSWGKYRKSRVQVTNIAARTVCLGGRTRLLPRIIMLGEEKGHRLSAGI